MELREFLEEAYKKAVAESMKEPMEKVAHILLELRNRPSHTLSDEEAKKKTEEFLSVKN